ncbi:mechanosensitive ion channel family protein [Balneolaceae bacterium YR4-1]|uniref:Mechanosensitive ion channel family protein n=1 Tax=Halalkalibaculum roseum TaxID=2709311 RepID=A0A6M1T2Z3_9BACT|nr:mechanosensitive ion channel family protein [Halalkalibaculum roseum]NGP76375.1 mechanosensitive ion channel family protein [Halalkalibaculum roseum]
MDSIFETIKLDVISLSEKLPLLIYAILIFAVFVILGKLVSKGIKKGIERGDFTTTYQTFFLKLVRGLFYIFGFLIALNTLGFTSIATSLLAGGGITAVVIGFAFREIGENILAGFFLAFSRPFSIGDLIQSEGLQGRVKGVELRHTHIRTAEGCDIYIPSSQIFNKPLHNYTRDGLRRAGFIIGVDYEDNIQKALELLVNELASIEEILKNPKPTLLISNFTPNFVEIQIYFWIDTFNQEISLGRVRTEAMEACRTLLIENNFTLSSSVSTSLEMDKLNIVMEKKE